MSIFNAEKSFADNMPALEREPNFIFDSAAGTKVTLTDEGTDFLYCIEVISFLLSRTSKLGLYLGSTE